jgi:hypothetical protein
MPKTASTQIVVIGIDVGKNSIHVVGHDCRSAIVLRQKWSLGQIGARLASLPPCACVGAIISLASSQYLATMPARRKDRAASELPSIPPVVQESTVFYVLVAR